MSRYLDRALGWFTDWFASGGGVWQTTIVTLAVVVVELIDRHLDPHAFVLMAVLTVYSAATQPALAHSGSVQSAHLERVLARLETLETKAVEREEAIAQLLEQNTAILKKLGHDA